MKMAEDERASFFRYSTSRGPGKRQIKPTAAVSEMVIPNDDDEDDEDFVGEVKTESGSGSDASSSDDSSSSGEESDGSDSEVLSDEDLNGLKQEIDVGEAYSISICTVCLNLREEAKHDEMISCDKCGLTVHEACYMTDLGDDASSTVSNSSTEPWFCEPCLFGLAEPPYCELCPNRFGAFKRCDIGGKWMHIICGLFTPGCTWGDADKLTAPSYEEIEYSKLFGKKQCSGCSSKVDARTGVASQCDAALCKTYFHPTCAQRLGLLVDRSDETHVNMLDARYIHCKKHSREEERTRKRAAYAIFIRQEERRMITMKRKRLNDREECTRLRNLRRLRKMHKGLVGITISWPSEEWDTPDKKKTRIRPLHTSKQLLDAFADKAEMYEGVYCEDFEKEFFRVRGENLPFLSPGFSTEFAAYFENREKKVFETERRRLATINAQNEELKAKLRDLESAVHSRSENNGKSSLEDALMRLHKFHTALTKLGVKKINNPFAEKIAEIKKSRKRTSSISVVHKPLSSKKSTPAKEKEKEKKPVLHKCHECHKITDQHLLIECDQCHFYYHLACLEPPLERMPKKTNFDWHCSNCLPSSSVSGDEQEDEEAVEDGPRKLRQRSDSVKAKKMQEAEAESKAYRSMMRSARRPPVNRKRKTPEIPPKKEIKGSPSTYNRSPHSRPQSKMSQASQKGHGGLSPTVHRTSPKRSRHPDTGVESEADSDEELVWILH